MPKRKRSEYESSKEKNAIQKDAFTNPDDLDGEESARSIAIQQKTIEQKIHHYRILLKRALKTAKGFEQQKLGKRLKAARKGKGKGKDGKAEVDRLEKELEELKNVDLGSLGASYLNKTLLKNRQLSTARYFPPSVAIEAEEASKQPAPTGPIANVCARLVNANPVKEAVKEVIGNLSQLLGIEETANGVGNSSRQTNEADGASEDKLRKIDIRGRTDDSDYSDDDLKPENELGSESESQSENEEVVEDDGEAVHPSMLKDLAARYLANGGMISSDEEEYSESELGQRIVLSSEDEDEDDDSEGSEPMYPSRGRSMSITPLPEDELGQSQESEDEDLDDLEDSDLDSKPAVRSMKQEEKPSKSTQKPLPPAPSGPVKSSAFLPTLMSGYISGSESDASISSSNNNNKNKKSKKGPAEKKVRKNRMGQQARRALAEKKYGTGANHIKKEKEEKEAKLKLKEEKRKAWEEKQTKAVHVSWQLKKKEKEEKDQIVKSMMSGGGKPMGKKIVFD